MAMLFFCMHFQVPTPLASPYVYIYYISRTIYAATGTLCLMLACPDVHTAPKKGSQMRAHWMRQEWENQLIDNIWTLAMLFCRARVGLLQT